MRTGIGYDIHPLLEDRALILAGVRVPHTRGLIGHSDADVLTHSIADALLGAIGEQDLGSHFPDTDPRYKDISSIELLREVSGLVSKHGFSLVNIDATIIAQQPRLSPYFEEMRKILGGVLKVSPQNINIKATSPEGIGQLGTGEGIASIAIATLKGPE